MQINFLLQAKILEFLNNNWKFRQLSILTWISIWTLQDLKNWNNNRKYNKKILDWLYKYFSIEKDNFYKNNCFDKIKKKWDSVGDFFKKKRLWSWYSIHDVAKKIKVSNRQIQRLEYGEINYKYNSYLIQELFNLYRFSQKEQNAIIAYSISLQNIIDL
jgi:hypothetical protein